jgi:hypothetical protein
MQHRRVAVIALLPTFLLFAHCERNDDSSDTGGFANMEMKPVARDFTIDFPSDWMVADNVPGSVSAMAPLGAALRPLIVASVRAASEPPDEDCLSFLTAYSAESLASFDVKERGELMIDNAAWCYVVAVYTAPADGGQAKTPQRAVFYSTWRNSRWYHVMGCVLDGDGNDEANLNEYRAEIERIVKTFQFERG